MPNGYANYVKSLRDSARPRATADAAADIEGHSKAAKFSQPG
jgi:hypothetical protein